MGDKDVILYFEDEIDIRKYAQKKLEEEFPVYNVFTDAGFISNVDNVLETAGGIERIALVCTDGSLLGGTQGWEIVEKLRGEGYEGPAIYTGFSSLPKAKEDLYVAKADKIDFINVVGKHLPETTN